MNSQATTLRLALAPRATTLADVTLVAAGGLFIALSAQVVIPLPFTPVPITGQTLAVLLVGASMGTMRGGASALLYLMVGLLGAPIYADGTHGWAIVTGASGGYLLAFPFAAALAGWLAEHRWDRNFFSAALALALSSSVIYLLGLVWLGLTLGTDLSQTLALGFFPFVLGDLIKVMLAALALPTAWRLVQKFKQGT